MLAGVQTFLQERPRAGTALLAESLERIRANAHDARELQVLAGVCAGRLAVDPELAAEAGRLLGGGSAAERLGLEAGASAAALDSLARSCLSRWRTLAENPLTDRTTAEACRIVVRGCEDILARAHGGSAGREAVRLLLGPEPRLGRSQYAQDQRGTG